MNMIDVNCPAPTPDEQLRSSGRRSLFGLLAIEVLTIIGIVCVLVGSAHAATESADSVTVQLRRGTSTVTLMPAPLTLAECEQRKAGLIAIDGDTRFSGTATYSCIETRRSVVTFSANAPPPLPVDCAVSAWTDWVLGTPTACANGQQTRQDSRTREIVTLPTIGGAECPALSETRTETLTCTVTPPPPATLPAVTAISATTSANVANPARYDVALSWLTVSGATGYEIERCTGATCTSNFEALGRTTNTAYRNTSIPGGFTYRYRIRGTAGVVLGAWSALRNVTTPTAPPPPTGTGTASLEWLPPTRNTDGSSLTNLAGFRIVYGPSAAQLTQMIQVSNAAVTTYTVEGLAPGSWFFAVRAYTSSGAESANSNVGGKVVP